MALIISGLQRSGTRLLMNLCNSHPEISVTIEFGNFLSVEKPYGTYIKRMFKRWVGIGTRNWPLVTGGGKQERWATVLQNHIFLVQYFLRTMRYRKDWTGAPSVEAILNEIFPETRVVGDKYPDYVFELDGLTRADGLFILVVYRDCRDVISSTLKEVRGDWRNMRFFTRKMNTVEKIAKRWTFAVEIMKRHERRLCIIRYEDLVRGSERELQKIGQWLNVDPEGFDAKIIKDDKIGKYRKGLSRNELAMAMQIAGSTMAQLGYV